MSILIPSKKVDQITPPSSHPKSVYPSPPNTDETPCLEVDRILAQFKAIKAGSHNLSPWTVFLLDYDGYKLLRRRLKNDEELWAFAEHKIRYDYHANRGKLVIRMPGPLHEGVGKKVEREIDHQLTAIAQGNGAAATFARGVEMWGSTTCEFPANDGKKSRHEPDASFRHSGALWPGVIIEVSHSQKRKDLPHLADTYLLDSDNTVQVVVGLDLEYGRQDTKKGTLTVWRVGVEDNIMTVVSEVNNEVFRDESRKCTDAPGLRLSLSDFAWFGKAELGDDDPEITIPAQKLAQFFTEVQNSLGMLENATKAPVAPGVRKRYRSLTPPEELASEDEARFAQDEINAQDKVSREDRAYGGSSLSMNRSEGNARKKITRERLSEAPGPN